VLPAETSQDPIGWLKAWALKNVCTKLVTFETFQFAIAGEPPLLKAAHSEKILSKVVTRETSQLPMFWLKLRAYVKNTPGPVWAGHCGQTGCDPIADGLVEGPCAREEARSIEQIGNIPIIDRRRAAIVEAARVSEHAFHCCGSARRPAANILVEKRAAGEHVAEITADRWTPAAEWLVKGIAAVKHVCQAADA